VRKGLRGDLEGVRRRRGEWKMESGLSLKGRRERCEWGLRERGGEEKKKVEVVEEVVMVVLGFVLRGLRWEKRCAEKIV